LGIIVFPRLADADSIHKPKIFAMSQIVTGFVGFAQIKISLKFAMRDGPYVAYVKVTETTKAFLNVGAKFALNVPMFRGHIFQTESVSESGENYDITANQITFTNLNL
jgi:hypothetical protein